MIQFQTQIPNCLHRVLTTVAVEVAIVDRIRSLLNNLGRRLGEHKQRVLQHKQRVDLKSHKALSMLLSVYNMYHKNPLTETLSNKLGTKRFSSIQDNVRLV